MSSTGAGSEADSGGDGETLQVLAGTRGPAGVAPFAGGTLQMTLVIGNPVATEASWITAEETRTVRFRGVLILEDANPDGGLLFSTNTDQGEPILLSVPSRSLLAVFEEP